MGERKATLIQPRISLRRTLAGSFSTDTMSPAFSPCNGAEFIFGNAAKQQMAVVNPIPRSHPHEQHRVMGSQDISINIPHGNGMDGPEISLTQWSMRAPV